MNTLANVWYPIAFASDIDADALFSRKVLGINIVFFRKSDGKLAALEDRCSHRFAPLSLGKKAGDCNVCADHGLQYEADGHGSHDPHGDGRIPNIDAVRSFSVCERYGIVWLWPGKSPADESLIPDVSFVEKPPVAPHFNGYLNTQCRYDVYIDNLLDLSLAEFLHPSLLSTNGAILQARPEFTEHPDGSISYSMRYGGKPAIGFFASFMPDPSANAEREMEARWWAPGLVNTSSSAWQGDCNSRDDWTATSGLHFIAPEAANSSHYSYIGSRNFLADDANLNEQLRQAAYQAFFAEDKPMLEAVQDRMGDAELFELNPVLLSSDAGAVRVRRRMEQMINAEATARRMGR